MQAPGDRFLGSVPGTRGCSHLGHIVSLIVCVLWFTASSLLLFRLFKIGVFRTVCGPKACNKKAFLQRVHVFFFSLMFSSIGTVLPSGGSSRSASLCRIWIRNMPPDDRSGSDVYRQRLGFI
jgi:hypothetical protein